MGSNAARLALVFVLALMGSCGGQADEQPTKKSEVPPAINHVSAEHDAAATHRPAPTSSPPDIKDVEDVEDVSFRTTITSLAQFRRFADRPGGIIRRGEVIKFLIDNRSYPKETAKIYYINSKFKDGGSEVASWVALHRDWAEKSIPGFAYTLKQFSKTAYFTTTLKKRDFISGRIQTFEEGGKVFLGVWFIEMDLISEEILQFALTTVSRTFTLSEYPLHFVQYSAHQTTERIEGWLAKAGFVVHRLSDLLADVDFQCLNVGEAWGILRVSPTDPDALEASDIPVFAVMPLDLAVVAGTITTAYQDVASHVNIKAKERRTPNLMLRDKAAIVRLKELDGMPVHLSVRDTEYSFELSTRTIVENKLKEQLAGRSWKMPPADLGGAIRKYDSMCRNTVPADCLKVAARYGGKAAGLGFLAHQDVIGEGSAVQQKLGYRLTPLGFAVPISYYLEFVEFNSQRDPVFAANLAKLIESEVGSRAKLSSPELRTLVRNVQDGFLHAHFPPGMYARLQRSIHNLERRYAKTFPRQTLKKLKFRSSANVEDIPSFNGAGLHDSYSAVLSKSDAESADAPCVRVSQKTRYRVKESLSPKSVACAVKAAYGSLWNLRAVRERSFRRFDHRGAYMGLAVVPSYKHPKNSSRGKIEANSVLFTRVLNAPTVYGYQLSTQEKNGLVTNPKPGTLSELTTLLFQLRSVPAPSVLQFARPRVGEEKRTTPILSTKTMREIVAVARAIEEAYCEAKPSYFVVNGKKRKCHQVSNSQAKPAALDMELKTYSNGDILFKQVREFHGR